MIVNQLDRQFGGQKYTGKEFPEKMLDEWKAEQVVGNQENLKEAKSRARSQGLHPDQHKERKSDRQEISSAAPSPGMSKYNQQFSFVVCELPIILDFECLAFKEGNAFFKNRSP